MIKYAYIFLTLFYLYGCGSPNRNEQKTIKQVEVEEPKQKFISYPDSGTVLKFYDDNWNLVHSKVDAKYFRIADYLDGRILSDVMVKDYYITGTLRFTGHLISENPDVPDGLTKWYNSDGQLQSERNYSNGNLHGKFVDYYASGNPKLLKYYSNGEIVGDYIEYYDIKNSIKTKGKVVNQKYHGKHQSYYENGSLESSKQYENGELSGKYIEYYQAGGKKIVGHYSKGDASDFWYSYDEDGDYKKYQYIVQRVGAICNDGTRSYATGRGACSWHGGVRYWLTESKKTFITGTGKYKNYNPKTADLIDEMLTKTQ